VLLVLGGCASEQQAIEDQCRPRVERIRAGLRTAYTDREAPADVAPWVGPIYREFVASSNIDTRASMLDAAVGRTIHGCYGLADAFHGAATADAGARRAAMAKLVPDALVSCRCSGVDVESLGFLLRLSPAP